MVSMMYILTLLKLCKSQCKKTDLWGFDIYWPVQSEKTG